MLLLLTIGHLENIVVCSYTGSERVVIDNGMNSMLFYLSFLLSFVSFSVHLGYGWILLRFALNCRGMNK